MSDLDDFSWENMSPNDNKYDTNDERESNIREAEGIPVPNNTKCNLSFFKFIF